MTYEEFCAKAKDVLTGHPILTGLRMGSGHVTFDADANVLGVPDGGDLEAAVGVDASAWNEGAFDGMTAQEIDEAFAKPEFRQLQGLVAVPLSDIEVLSLYPEKALVSQFYDVTDGGDQAFGDALNHIFGDSFEYPNFAHRTIGEVMKMAVNKLEQSAVGGGVKVAQGVEPDSRLNTADADHSVQSVRSGKTKIFEVTGFGFDGSSDETDDRVFWITAQSHDEVKQAVAGTNAGFHDTIDSETDIDFHLPADAELLKAKLLEFEPTERKIEQSGLDQESKSEMCFAVFDIDAQKNLLPYYVTRKQAENAKSAIEAEAIARQKGPYAVIDAKIDQSLLGKVLGVTDSHVVLSLGRSAAIVAQSDLSRVPAMGEEATIVFKGGNGLVADMSRFKYADKGR